MYLIEILALSMVAYLNGIYSVISANIYYCLNILFFEIICLIHNNF